MKRSAPYRIHSTDKTRLVSVREVPEAYLIGSVTFSEQVCSDMYGDLPFGMYVLPNASIRGDAGYIFTEDGSPILEQNADFLRKGRFLRPRIEQLSPDADRVAHNGELISLISRCDNCFWHWMMDSLPKVLVAETCGYSGSYLVPSRARAPWAKESMTMLGIDEVRVQTKETSDLTVERLFIPTYFCGYNAHHNLPFLRLYRDRLRHGAGHSQTSDLKGILIGRPETAPARRVLNQDEVAAHVSELGIETVFFEELPLREQIGLAASADLIIGPHSSGLTHLLFMKDSSNLIELFPFERKVTNDCYEQLANALGHSYTALVSEEDSQTDIVVDIEALRRLIKET